MGLPYGVQNEWINNRELDIEMTPIIDGEGYLVGAAIYGSEGGTWVDILTLAITERLTGRPAIQDLRLPDADLHVGNHFAGALAWPPLVSVRRGTISHSDRCRKAVGQPDHMHLHGHRRSCATKVHGRRSWVADPRATPSVRRRDQPRCVPTLLTLSRHGESRSSSLSVGR